MRCVLAVRAKFKVQAKTLRMGQRRGEDGQYRDMEVDSVDMTPVTSDSSEENKAFWFSTPTGSINMGMVNKPAADYFQLGKEYYVTFELAE